MTLKPRLIVRPNRDSAESRINYLLRLAQRNYLSGLPELAKLVGLVPRTLVSMTDDALAQYLRGIDLRSIAPPVHRPNASLELVRRRLWSRCRICPICLRSGNITPMYFDLCLSLRCEEHQIFLLDRCLSCNRPLSYLRKRSLHCDCGQSLAKLPATKVDSSVDLFESLLTPWREDDRWFQDEELVLDREVSLAKTLRTIIGFVSGNRDLGTRIQPWIWLEDWPVIRSLLSPWPTALIDGVLTSDRLADSARVAQLLAALQSNRTPYLQKLKRRLDDHRKEARQPLSRASEPLVSLSQVRKLAKLDAAAAIELFNSPYFSVKEVRKGPKGNIFLVSSADFNKMVQWFNETVTLEQAAEIIGCTPMSVRALSRIGELHAEFLPSKPRSPRFSRSEIDKFIKSIEVRLSNDSSAEHSMTSLAKIAPANANSKRRCSNWPILIRGIFTGTVPVFRLSNKRGWEGIGVRVGDAQKCIYTVD